MDIEQIKDGDRFVGKEGLEEEYQELAVYTHVLQHWHEGDFVKMNCTKEVAMAKMNETAKKLGNGSVLFCDNKDKKTLLANLLFC